MRLVGQARSSKDRFRGIRRGRSFAEGLAEAPVRLATWLQSRRALPLRGEGILELYPNILVAVGLQMRSEGVAPFM